MSANDPLCDPKQIAVVSIYETKHFYALYDKYPIVKGHSLIITKRHMSDITEFSDEESKDFDRILKKVVPILLAEYSDSNSYDLSFQIGKNSGRTISHLHAHIIPRRSNDSFQGKGATIFKEAEKSNQSWDVGKRFSQEDVKKEVAKLRSKFGYKP